MLKSESSVNFYHGLAYIGATAGIRFGADPGSRWSSRNSFDTGIRDGLRLSSASQRKDADLISDLTLALSIGVLPSLTIGVKFSRTQDCVETWDMFADAMESIGLTLFATELVKLVAAGAGLTWSFAVKRDAWGTSSTARAAPCALGVAAALATGLLRISADRHWGSDVLAGFGIGALVGYFDTWGPLDLLKFCRFRWRYRHADRAARPSC